MPSDEDKYMLAAFLGNVAQETGELRYTTELAPPDYAQPCTLSTCGSSYGKFWGRGALQVTCWGGNPCSAYQDVVSNGYISSLDDIDQISTDPAAAWGSGLVFWMSNTGVGAKGPAAKYVAQKCFGGTYAVINGAIECPAGTLDSRVANRIKNFEAAASAMGVDVSSWTMTCPGAGPSPSPPSGNMFCGASWADANTKCATACDGTDAACASGEHCYADLSGC